MLEWIEAKSIAYSLVKMIRNKHIKHTAEKVAKLMRMVFKSKRLPEEKKKDFIKGAIYFGECVAEELKKIWELDNK